MLNIQMERRGKKIFPINKIPHWIDFWGRAVLLFFLFFFNECTVKEEQLQLNSYTVWKHHSWNKDKGLLEHIEGHKTIFNADTSSWRRQCLI